jgi:hypothetical protein
MDDGRFDAFTRALSDAESRRGVLGRLLVVAGILGSAALPDAAEARKRKGKGRKKGKGKKKPRQREKSPPGEQCGSALCTDGRFCCDDQRAICCSPGDSCCNLGPGTGICCPSPNRCGRPWGNDNAPSECCPPERQWFTHTGVVRCCPPGTRSLGTGITSDDGPCCPEEKYCSQELTGGKCCGDLAPVCMNRATGRCCTPEGVCGNICCSGMFGVCCNGECRLTELGPWSPCGEFCCPGGKTCCTNGGQAICCDPDDVCPAPCGDLPIACCTPESHALGHCCNSDCGDSCGG